MIYLKTGDGVIAQQLRTCANLAEDRSLISCTHMEWLRTA